MAKKGIGIIGYGGFGEFIHKAWDAMDNAHVVAACDSDSGRDPGGIAFYRDVDEFLKDSAIDIVSIATPPSSHKDLAVRAMRAGKHALIEKPLALTEADGREIIAVAKETNRVATVDFVLRFDPIVEMLGEIVKSGVFGKIRRADLRNYAMQDTVPEGHWFWNPDVSGRILVEHGVHFFDLAGTVINARATDMWSLGVDRKPGIEDRVFAAVKYEGGAVGTYWHSFSRPRELETTAFHFAFDLGEIEMKGWIPLELKIWGWTDQKGLSVIDKLTGGRFDCTELENAKAHSSEFMYDVEYEVDATIELDKPKMEVYADCLRSIMADMIAAIDDPSHKMRVTIENALEAVRIAEKATLAAHPPKGK